MKKLIASLFLLAAAVVLAAPVTNVPITGLPEGTKFSAASNWIVVVTNGPSPLTVKMSPQSFLTNISGLAAWTNLITLATSNTAYVAAGSNATVVTNTVGGARIYTVSSTATGGGTNTVLTNSISSQTWNVEQFGALHDGAIAKYAIIPTGTNYLVASAGTFSASDTGKVISIYMAGAATNNFTTHITNFISSASVLLSNNAPRGVTNVSAVFGTDDTPAIQLGISTICSNNGGTLYFPSGIYVVNGAVKGANTNDRMHYISPDVRTNFGVNAQFYAPIMQASGQVLPVLRFQGTFAASPKEPGTPAADIFSAAGTTLWSTLADAQGGAMFACEPASNYVFIAGTDLQRRLNGLGIEIENMTWRMPRDPNGTAIDLRGTPTAKIRNVLIDCGYGLYSAPQPTHPISVGIWLPQTFSQGMSVVDNLTVIGFYNGIGGGEHTVAGPINIWNCWNGINWTNSAGHLCVFQRLDMELVKNYLVSGISPSIHILANIASENPSSGSNVYGYPAWDYPPVLLNDNYNTFDGEIVYEHTGTNAAESLGEMTCYGGAYVSLYNFGYGKAKTPLQAIKGPSLVINQDTNTLTDPIQFNLMTNGYVLVNASNDASSATILLQTEATAFWGVQKRPLVDTGEFRVYSVSTNGYVDHLRLSYDSKNSIFIGGVLASNLNIRQGIDAAAAVATFTALTNGYFLFQKENDVNNVALILKTTANTGWGIQKNQDGYGGGGLFRLYSSTNFALAIDTRMEIDPYYGNVWFYGNVISNGPVAWVNTTNNGAGNGSIVTSINGELWIRTGGAWRKIIDNKSIYSEITNGFVAGDGSGKLMATNIYTFPTNPAVNGAEIDLNRTYQYTNAAGAITYTGLLNVENDKCKTANILINANGSDRVVTIPGNWMNHEDATAFTVTNGWFAELTVKCYGNAWTSAVWLLIK